MWTKAFLLAAFENAVTTGIAAFAASDFFQKAFTVRGLEVAASAAGMSALYQFVKNLGGVSAVKALTSGKS